MEKHGLLLEAEEREEKRVLITKEKKGSVNKHLSSICCVPGTVLRAADRRSSLGAETAERIHYIGDAWPGLTPELWEAEGEGCQDQAREGWIEGHAGNT